MASGFYHTLMISYSCLRPLGSHWNLQPESDLRDFIEAGFVVNLEKSMLHHAQSIPQLGMIVDSVSGEFEVPASRWDKLQATIESPSSAHRNRVPVR